MRIFLFIFLSISLHSQDFGTVSGQVKDAISGDGLPGVNVMIKGTYYGAQRILMGIFISQKSNPGVMMWKYP